MHEQSAAIPYRQDSEGAVQVLLITSRRTRRWIIPKGKIEPGMIAPVSAAREAFEEAGVMGRLIERPVGTYIQIKTGAGGRTESIAVRAFALEVADELAVWPEMHERERRWFTLPEALEVIADEQIQALLRAFELEFDS